MCVVVWMGYEKEYLVKWWSGKGSKWKIYIVKECTNNEDKKKGNVYIDKRMYWEKRTVNIQQMEKMQRDFDGNKWLFLMYVKRAKRLCSRSKRMLKICIGVIVLYVRIELKQVLC